ncbi:hypothetical protein EFW17_20475 [Halostreptopolyspora alba]|uniref:Terpene synthase n=2 Tax=Halostreptopolyspora alba TaxID=2487137 RepID=A0A3N0E2R9_9ACTN|nr:hypothetical protein EFW17_20475 [Nocardiopsaceae bacterium YIM 96095]
MESFDLFGSPTARRQSANTDSARLISYMMPNSAPTDLVQLGSDLFYLAFSFDDHRTDTGSTSRTTDALVNWFHDFMYAITVGTQGCRFHDPYHRAAAELSQRIRELTPPKLWRRWLDLCQGVAWAAAWEAAQRHTGTPGTLDDFLLVRRDLGFATGATIHIEIAAELAVPESERYDLPVKAAVEAAEMLLCLDDDIYSYPKEHWQAEHEDRRMPHEPTAIPLLMREHGCGVTEAFHHLADLRNRIMLRAVRLAERVRSGQYHRDTRTLVDLSLGCVRAGLDWAPNAKRYTDPDGQSEVEIELVWTGITDRPLTTDAPAPYPTIAWWWDV